MRQIFSFKGIWKFTCRNRYGNLLWQEHVHNLITNQALDHALDALFAGATQYDPWYVLLFKSNDTPALTWTYANIGTDFTEFTDYDESTREAYVDSAVASQSINNSASPAEFTCSTGISDTIYGACIVNASTKGDNAASGGLIWSGVKFGTSRPFNATDVLQVVYTLTTQNA